MHPIVEFLKAVDRNAGEPMPVLLDRILAECRAYTDAEAGTVFLLRDDADGRWLQPMSLQNDVLALEPADFIVPVDEKSIAGYVAATGASLLIEDAYEIPADVPYRFNTAFDDCTGYRTRSVACVALRRNDGGVCAVVQLINRKPAEGRPLPFDAGQTDFIAAAGVIVAGVIERAEMVGKLAERNRELRRQYATIEALQAETEAALREARRSDEAKSRFLACIGHELKTPLNAIIGFSELMKNEGFGPLGHPSYRAFVGDIADGGHRLLAIVNDILSIVGAESNARALRDDWKAAYACVEDAARSYFEIAAEANVILAADIADEPCACAVDRIALRTALERLIDNAVKFTPAGGEVCIAVGPAADGGLWIEIADTGIGMTDADVATALTPFGQVDSSYSRHFEGAGLGLTLALAQTRAMNGALAVRSAPGQGTTVELLFPARTPAAAEANRATGT